MQNTIAMTSARQAVRNLAEHSALMISLSALCCLLSACNSDIRNGSAQVPFTADPNEGRNLRAMAAAAESYSITYGALSQADIDTLKTYPLVILHPYNGNISRNQIMEIKQGVNLNSPDDNVLVLCYISVGEDSRTYGLTDEQMRKDPRFTGDGSGPVVDPRWSNPGSRSLVGLNPTGISTNGGFASYYLNDNPLRCPGDPVDVPDQNINFLTRFVNAGDPLWYETVNSMIMDESNHTPPGLKELLRGDYGRSLGCDGVFLDTIDTAAPNRYTKCTASNHTSSEWTAKGFSDFIHRLRADYPDKVILQNRGLFFFDPREPHYEVSARGAIDLGFFESYYLDNDSESVVSPYYIDNKYNVVPKIMAEASRPDGFKMLSLGYANGFTAPKPGIDINTLLGTSTVGYDTLLTDTLEALSVGFRPYITSASVDFINLFVKNNTTLEDTTPPRWSSVYNENFTPPKMPSPRAGIQKLTVTDPGSVKIFWDVALDMNRVEFLLYYQTTPFDFEADPALTAATRVTLVPEIGNGYADAWNSANPEAALKDLYPYESTISNLQQGVTFYFLLRAVDSKGNEEDNRAVLTATP